MKLPLYFWLEIAAFVVTLVFLTRILKSRMAVLAPQLAITVLYEFGTLSGWFWYRNSNHLAANIFTGVEFTFYAFLFNSVILGSKSRIILIPVLLFGLFFTINLMFIEGSLYYNSYTLLVMSLVIIYWCYIVLHQTVLDVNNFAILKNPSLWIFSGILLFYLLQFSKMLLFNYIAYSGDFSYAKLFLIISDTSNFILYTFIITGIVCQNLITIRR